MRKNRPGGGAIDRTSASPREVTRGGSLLGDAKRRGLFLGDAVLVITVVTFLHML